MCYHLPAILVAWGLRDYGLEPLVWDAAPGCEHEWREHIQPAANGLVNNTMQGETLSGNSATRKPKLSAFCSRCPAWIGSLGLEPTPDLYVQHLIEIFREVWRVLRHDGIVWLNMGDCYATGAGMVGEHPGGGEQGARWRGDVDRLRDKKRGYRGKHGKPSFRRDRRPVGPMTQPNRMPLPGLKPKDLVGIPWRLAFALQADGWWLRSDIVWAKPNPMPESVRDRPTKAHEYVFLLTKSERYYYDMEAVRESFDGNFAPNHPRTIFDNGPPPPPGQPSHTGLRRYKAPDGWDRGLGAHGTIHRDGRSKGEPDAADANPAGRNLRSVWTIAKNEEAQWIGKLGVCQRCGGLKAAGLGQVPTTPPAMGDSGDQASDAPIAPSMKLLSDPSLLGLQLTICAETRDASTQAILNPSPSESTSIEETRQQPATSLRDSVRKDTNTAPTIRINAATVNGNAVSVCACEGGDNSRGSVWHIATEAFAGAHFATFPSKLVETCVKAGTSERGACAACGAPWQRVVERAVPHDPGRGDSKLRDADGLSPRAASTALRRLGQAYQDQLDENPPKTVGWQPTCGCASEHTRPCLVLDPFCGSGTVPMAAQELGRVGIGLDLKSEYLAMAKKRTAQRVIL